MSGCEGFKPRKRTWLQRLLFGDIPEAQYKLLDALQSSEKETAEFREALREVAAKDDPLLQLFRNMHKARQAHNE